MTPNHVVQLTDALIALFDPLVQAIEDSDSARALLKDMGYEAPSEITLFNDFSPLLNALMDVANEADDIVRSGAEADYLAIFRNLIDAIQEIIRLIGDIGNRLQTNFPPDFLAETDMVAQFPRQLADYLLVRMIERRYPVLHSSLLVTGIIDEAEVTTAATPFNTPYTKRVIRWKKLGDYVNNPLRSMQEAYGWNTDNFDYESLIGNIHRFARSLRFFSSFANPDPDTLQALNSGVDVVTDENADKLSILKFPLLPVLDAMIGAEIYPVLNTTKDKAAGLGLGLYFDPSAGLSFPITDDLSLDIKYGGSVPLDAGVLILPDRPLQSVSNIFGGAGPQANLSKFIPEFIYKNADEKTLLFDSSIAKLAFVSWALRAGILADVSGFFIETDIKGASFTISGDETDGFVKELLPSQPVVLDFDLTIGFSSKTGLYFGGGLGLEVKFFRHISIGPAVLQGIIVSLKSADNKIPLTLGADISASLGPVEIIVENMGAALTLSFPDKGDGNLGPMQVDLDFKPPSGAGLSIDEAMVTGGGFLRYDKERGQYEGIVQLNLEGGIAVTGIGLIATRLPNNVKGFSLLIIITAEDFKPIPLPLGFALTGIGGLIAINRTFDQNRLRAGLKNHTLDTLLFPHDPIRNAPQILSNLNAVFPSARGHHLFGPMLQISWGSPPLITANLALVLEFGARLRLLFLAQVAALLPSRENDLIRLQMDAVGIIDFDQSNASLDATLFDSRLLKKFVLTGDMAMRLNWKGSPNFALAVGGLHPAFNPPPAFPKLDRIAINLSSGDNPRFRCEAYFAITSNTVQFGARAELYASAAGFNIHGEVSFDVLIEFNPFFFLAEFHAQLQLKRGSTNLFKVRVEGSLAGPRPLHIKGKATFEILWWDVSIRIDKRLVEGEKPPPPEPIDVMVRLKEALENAGNWVSQPPGGQRQMVTLRTKTAGAAEVNLHPLGLLRVKQNVVPLNMDISKFGQAVPSGARRFTITSVILGKESQPAKLIKEFFAPAQYLEMSEEEKLSRPSFEALAAGVELGSEKFEITAESEDWLEVEGIEFETFIVDKKGSEPRSGDTENRDNLYKLSIAQLGKQSRFGAAGRSEIRRTGKEKYRAVIGKYKVVKEGWTVISSDESVEEMEAGEATSYTEAAQTIERVKRENRTRATGMKIVRLSELSES